MRTGKCRWPGSTPRRCASSLFVSCQSPSWPSISRTRTRSGWPRAFSCSGLSSISVSSTARQALLHIETPLSSRELGCSSAIQDCNDAAAGRPYEARRRIRARLRREDACCSVGLRLARHDEDDLTRAAQRRQAQRDAVDERLQSRLGRKDPLALAKRRCVRKERRDVTIRAETE